jgi:hypothetical protein
VVSEGAGSLLESAGPGHSLQSWRWVGMQSPRDGAEPRLGSGAGGDPEPRPAGVRFGGAALGSRAGWCGRGWARATAMRPGEQAVASPCPTRVGGGLASLVLPSSAAAAGAGGSGLIGRILG